MSRTGRPLWISHPILSYAPQVAPENRVGLAVSMTKTWPKRIIFARRPRFNEGLRWPFRLFLSLSDCSIVGDKIQANCSSQNGPLGVSVTFPGYVFEEWVPLAGFTGSFLFYRGSNSLEPPYKDTIQDFQPNRRQDESSQRLAGLIIKRSPWATQHTHAISVSLDKSDARDCSMKRLSCFREGVCGLFPTYFGSSWRAPPKGVIARVDWMLDNQN